MSVFLDFDGTISTVDVGMHVLERPRPKSGGGSTTVRRGGDRQPGVHLPAVGLVPRDEDRLRAVAREVPLDPGFGPLVDGLRAKRCRGHGRVGRLRLPRGRRCRPFGVDMLTNAVDFRPASSCSPTRTGAARAHCGVCKQAPIKDAPYRGQHHGAHRRRGERSQGRAVGRRLFAKVGPAGRPTTEPERAYGLAEWCELADVAYEPFVSLADVHATLLG